MTNRRLIQLGFAALFGSLVTPGAGCSDDDAADPSSPGQGGTGQGGGLVGGAGATGGWAARFDPFVDALLAELAASDAYGVSVAVMEGGELTFAEAFGSKDPYGLEPLTPNTLMQIGSTTKQMTAVALLRKVEQGLLSVDDTLAQALPSLEFANDETWNEQVLVRHLLSHQGAFLDDLPWFAASDDALLASYSYGTFAEEWFLMNPPGAFWNYSNPNFILAGLITEELDERAWPDVMREDLFLPLGMDRTYLRKSEVEADGDYSLSYGIASLSSATLRDVDMAHIGDAAWIRPAGLAWTTPTQMMAWADFLMRGNDEVLSDELRGEVTSAQVDTLYAVGTMAYGYGLFVETGYMTEDGTWYETPVWEHGGNTLSFTHMFYVLPELDIAVAICTSGYATDFQPAMDVAITTLADLPAPSAGPVYDFDPAALDRHVGSYDDAWQLGAVTVTRDGDSLVIDIPALTAQGSDYTPTLTAISSEIFSLQIDGYPFELTFVPAEPGGDSIYIRNRSFVATRVPAAGPQAAGVATSRTVEGRADPSAAPPRLRDARVAAASRRIDLERWRRQAELSPSPVQRFLASR